MNIPSIVIILATIIDVSYCDIRLPLVINTWGFSNATESAWDALHSPGADYIDALIKGCSQCERDQCDGSVGFGGSPNENGETTLDAMIFDGVHMNMGGVAAMRRIKNAIAVAGHVLKHTTHSLLVGDEATNFAKQMNFTEEDLTTNHSRAMWQRWRYNNACQPNYWLNVEPDPREHCGPYKPLPENSVYYNRGTLNVFSHDTVGMIVVDQFANIAAATSTNGMTFKVAGRVGDSALPGAGAYADKRAGGAAVATGDGDILMRFLPTVLAVERMNASNVTAVEAARYAIDRVRVHYPMFFGAVVVVGVTANGTYHYGAACNGVPGGWFPFSVRYGDMVKTRVEKIQCTMG